MNDRNSYYRMITGTLIARTAVHIGSGDDSALTDALIRRNAQGQVVIPGTAIAGALRSLLTRLAPRLGADVCHALGGSNAPCGCDVCRLFGDVNPADEAESQSAASHALVFDARLIEMPSQTTIRDSVGIERTSGAAARAGAAKFDLEVVPADSRFELRIELRGMNGADEQLLAAGLAEWQAGRAWLGGRVGRGLGAFRLENPKLVERELKSAAQLVAFLKDDQPWRNETSLTTRSLDEQVKQARQRIDTAGVLPNADSLIARRWLAVELTLAAEGPLLTNDALASGASGFDHAPLLASVEGWDKPVLTGAGLRGVLRSHAERIARTLATLNVQGKNDDERREHFLQHCPACDPTARRLGSDAPALESCDSLLRYDKGKESDAQVEPEEMCLACRLFGSPRFGSRLLVEDAPFVGNKPVYKMMDFLAIDRFTGGGAEHFKFDALALWKPRFTARLFLDNPEDWELGWLALVLRDWRDGWLSVGFGAAKGFGRVTIPQWKVRLGFLRQEDFPGGKQDTGTQPKIQSAIQALTSVKQPDGVFWVVGAQHDQPDVHTHWLTCARAWVAAFHDQLKNQPRDPSLKAHQDSYFGRVEHLYSREVAL